MKKIITILCITLFVLPIVSVSALKNNTFESSVVLPAAFSWRDINGTDYTTRHQRSVTRTNM